jgi:hypothetical protein
MDPNLRLFIWGAIAMGCTAIALCFLRYWRHTRERLFAFFALAFFSFAMNWIGLAFIDPGAELRHTLYLFRLAAFVLIILGIVDKNRRTPSAGT